MKIYTYKKRWKWLLFLAAVLIVIISLWYTNQLVRKIAKDERQRVKIWANAIQRKADLVNYTDVFFEKIRKKERKSAELWAKAYRHLIDASVEEELNFYWEIISSNEDIPLIYVSADNVVINSDNLDNPPENGSTLSDEEIKAFTSFEPIQVIFGNKIYYQESKIYTDLRQVLEDLTESFFTEVVHNNSSVPVIVTDSTSSQIITYGNIDSSLINDSIKLQAVIAQMQEQNNPIEIHIGGDDKKLIYYKDSQLLTQLRYYPVVQFIIIGLFLIVAYILFSISRKAEQNQVWVGMAKETAHQLGTPLSSLMAWVELLKMQAGENDEMAAELQKDVNRLEIITDRFSKIGSTPKLQGTNILQALQSSISYIRSRTSKKVEFSIQPLQSDIEIPLNVPLFSWVIENLCKNAVDAMEGQGSINIQIEDSPSELHIDISDTGKGIPKGNFKTVFNPGYTSKKRGWGLGLSLAHRIINNYHRGKIFVKSSNPGLGTTFRITLPKK